MIKLDETKIEVRPQVVAMIPGDVSVEDARLVGYVEVSREVLAMLFKQPPMQVGNGETIYEYRLKFGDGAVVTLYDRKQTVPDDDVRPYVWHIGSNRMDGHKLVRGLLLSVSRKRWRMKSLAQEEAAALRSMTGG